jgi:hypothetical protein
LIVSLEMYEASRASMGTPTKRQRIGGHLIAGLGDGDAHKRKKNLGPPGSTTDDLFRRRSGTSQRVAYIRGTRNTRAKPFTLEEVYPSGDGIHSVHKPSVSPTSWQCYVMALIAMMGLLLALFLHLVTDNAPNQKNSKKRSPHRHKKKKTDEWSDDYETEDYGGDNEGAAAGPGFGYYYPKEPEYPKHRRAPSKNEEQLNRNFYFSAEQQSVTAYRSPSNSFYQSQQDASPKIVSPIRAPIPSSGAAKSKRLSPISSFASMPTDGNTSDSSTNLPLPPGVTRGSSSLHSSNSQPNASSLMPFSPRHDMETPKVGNRRLVMDIPNAPSLESPSLDATAREAAGAAGAAMIPFMPNLSKPFAAPPQPISVEELQSEMESGNIQHDFSIDYSSLPSFARLPEDKAPSFAIPPHVLNASAETEAEDEEEVSSSGGNDPRKNIVHKRKDLTLSTDTTKSLMGTIQFDEIQLEEVIGGGGFGQVWKATWRSTPVAVKVLTGSAQRVNVSRAILEEFVAEINMLKGMRHPNICLYMGACLDPPNRAIVTELAANGSLWDALRMPLQAPYLAADGETHTAWPLKLYNRDRISPLFPSKGTWPWVLVKRVASGAARGMTYLHSGTPPVLHRDLKSANLLLDESYTTKVCDFGLSRLKAQERSMTGNCGTVQWMAPEILANQPYAEPADVFSFGIILWELLTRECPYDGMTAIQCALAVLNRDQRPQIPAWCPPAFQSLIQSCVKRDPSQRPTFAQVCAALEAMP